MITIRKMNLTDKEKVLKLKIKDDQHAFVSPIENIITKKKPNDDFHLILYDYEISGFFIIDRDYYKKYNFSNENEIGLLGYFIDKNFQGKGIGKNACLKLKEYLSRIYPLKQKVVLTVNAKNPSAIKTYLAGGFIDTKEFYYGGRSGPQHIFKMKLQNKK